MANNTITIINKVAMETVATFEYTTPRSYDLVVERQLKMLAANEYLNLLEDSIGCGAVHYAYEEMCKDLGGEEYVCKITDDFDVVVMAGTQNTESADAQDTEPVESDDDKFQKLVIAKDILDRAKTIKDIHNDDYATNQDIADVIKEISGTAMSSKRNNRKKLLKALTSWIKENDMEEPVAEEVEETPAQPVSSEESVDKPVSVSVVETPAVSEPVNADIVIDGHNITKLIDEHWNKNEAWACLGIICKNAFGNTYKKDFISKDMCLSAILETFFGCPYKVNKQTMYHDGDWRVDFAKQYGNKLWKHGYLRVYGKGFVISSIAMAYYHRDKFLVYQTQDGKRYMMSYKLDNIVNLKSGVAKSLMTNYSVIDNYCKLFKIIDGQQEKETQEQANEKDEKETNMKNYREQNKKLANVGYKALQAIVTQYGLKEKANEAYSLVKKFEDREFDLNSEYETYAWVNDIIGMANEFGYCDFWSKVVFLFSYLEVPAIVSSELFRLHADIKEKIMFG